MLDVAPFLHFLLFLFCHLHFIHLLWLEPVLLSNFIQVLHIVPLPFLSLAFFLSPVSPPLLPLLLLVDLTVSYFSPSVSLCTHKHQHNCSHKHKHNLLTFPVFLTSSFPHNFLALIHSFLSDHPPAYFPFSSLIGRAPYLSS